MQEVLYQMEEETGMKNDIGCMRTGSEETREKGHIAHGRDVRVDEDEQGGGFGMFGWRS